jgi:hypothetical protein
MSTHSSKEKFSDAVARQLAAYTKLYHAQLEVTPEPPAQFHFPEPANDIERAALRIFIQTVEQKIGMPIKIVHTE